jgi:hypothetical protein
MLASFSHSLKTVTAVAFAGVFALQAYFAAAHCHASVLALWEATAISLLPAIVFVPFRRYLSSVVAIITITAFFLWANYQECIKPYAGGGAAMAYLVVFLYGIPLSLVAGLLFVRVKQHTPIVPAQR